MDTQGELFDRVDPDAGDNTRKTEVKKPGKIADSLEERFRTAYDDLLREREATDLRLEAVKEELSKLEILKEKREKVRQYIAIFIARRES